MTHKHPSVRLAALGGRCPMCDGTYSKIFETTPVVPLRGPRGRLVHRSLVAGHFPRECLNPPATASPPPSRPAADPANAADQMIQDDDATAPPAVRVEATKRLNKRRQASITPLTMQQEIGRLNARILELQSDAVEAATLREVNSRLVAEIKAIRESFKSDLRDALKHDGDPYSGRNSAIRKVWMALTAGGLGIYGDRREQLAEVLKPYVVEPRSIVPERNHEDRKKLDMEQRKRKFNASLK